MCLTLAGGIARVALVCALVGALVAVHRGWLPENFFELATRSQPVTLCQLPHTLMSIAFSTDVYDDISISAIFAWMMPSRFRIAHARLP